MAVEIALKYRQFFGETAAQSQPDWETFSSTPAELVCPSEGGLIETFAGIAEWGRGLARPLSERASAFSINDPVDHTAKVIKVVLFVLKIVIFPWGLYELTRYVVQRLIMMPLYPAQSSIATALFGLNPPNQLLVQKALGFHDLVRLGYRVREVVLEKNRVRYQGIMVGHQSTIDNGKWALQATGNCEPIETSFSHIARIYKEHGYNTLLVNGPAVSLSEGQATPESMGEAQEVGLRFLEEAVQAHTMLIAGRSLGGVAIGQMVLGHEFHAGRSYVVASQMTFDKVSNIVQAFARDFFPLSADYVPGIIRWTGLEMDTVRASRKLASKSIPEIVIQACFPPPEGVLRVVVNDNFKELTCCDADQITDDGVIPGSVGLAKALLTAGITQHKYFWGLERVLGSEIHNSFKPIEQTAQFASGLQTNQVDRPAVRY